MFMIMFVLDDSDLLEEVLGSWSELGVTGATIVETSGLQRLRRKHIPMRFNYGGISAIEEVGNITLFAIVKNEQMVEECLKAAEKVVGDLDSPNTGVFSAWPLTMTKGIHQHVETKD
ncbi:MAG: hypothetical protein AB2L18_12485 [Anaerolineaceae bacterium]